MNQDVIRFRGRRSHFRLDRRAGQLVQDPSSFISLPAKEFYLLEFFATNPKTLFSKDELIEKVWGKDSAPSDDALARAISVLRQALGDDPAAPEFITTVHKRGYRFDGEIEADSTVTASAGACGGCHPRLALHSVAVACGFDLCIDAGAGRAAAGRPAVRAVECPPPADGGGAARAPLRPRRGGQDVAREHTRDETRAGRVAGLVSDRGERQRHLQGHQSQDPEGDQPRAE